MENAPFDVDYDDGDEWVCSRPIEISGAIAPLCSELNEILNLDPNAKFEEGTHSLAGCYFVKYRMPKEGPERKNAKSGICDE